MQHRGKERRRRRVYTTLNTEYHTFDDVCVAVRDRRGGGWQDRHQALDLPIQGAVRLHQNGAAVPCGQPPRVGDALFFTLPSPREERQLVTSRLLDVSRPDRQALAHYPGGAAVAARSATGRDW